jgi:phosphoglycerol transferase MdoB-like AlkP superfamily enzyme
MKGQKNVAGYNRKELSTNLINHIAHNDRYIPLYRFTLCYLLVSLILRLTLSAIFGPPAHVPFWHFPAIIGLGLVNDFVETLYLLVPFSLYLLLMPQRAYSSWIGRFIMASSLWVLLFGMLYLATVQFFFFQEFDARFNLVAVDYLIYPHEVFVNIWQSYPVGRVLIIMAVLSSVIMIFLWPKIRNSMHEKTTFRRRIPPFSIHIVLLSLMITCFSTHTLGFFQNRVSNELIANGLSSFFQAFHTNQLDYDQFYHTADSAKMFSLLKKQLLTGGNHFTTTLPTDITRSFAEIAKGLGKLNIVVIVEESLGCEHMDGCGQGLDIDSAVAKNNMLKTPFLDEFSHQGLFFNRAYATGTRTVRGLEAISASFPPIPSESIMKRPGSDHIATWGKVMRENGYHTSFLYGGYGQFDNMNAYFRSNGFAISDRLDIKNPIFTNIWGVSDQDLFRHARSYFDQVSQDDKPFFSIIMSTSNHSPYTFPAGIPGVPAKGGGRNAGVLYADYALRDFFAKAKDHAWYTNTLFVIVADHGARVYGEAQIPLPSYEIPLLIIAPGHLKPGQIQTPISQMDIAPTILGLLGLPYTAPFFGQNVLAQNSNPHILLFNHNHDVALYQKEKLVVLGLRDDVNTYHYKLGTNLFDKIPNEPNLTKLATAYYQCAFELFKGHHYN